MTSSDDDLPPVKDEEYFIDRVLGHRIVDGVSEFLVRWRGYDSSYDSWEPEESFLEYGTIRDYLALEPATGQDVKVTYSSRKNGKIVRVNAENTLNKNAAKGVCPNGHTVDCLNKGVFHLSIDGQIQTIEFPINLKAEK